LDSLSPLKLKSRFNWPACCVLSVLYCAICLAFSNCFEFTKEKLGIKDSALNFKSCLVEVVAVVFVISENDADMGMSKTAPGEFGSGLRVAPRPLTPHPP
jgi:hypothetical protein